MSAKIDSDLQAALQKVTGKLKEGSNCLTNDIKVPLCVFEILSIFLIFVLVNNTTTG